MWQIWIDRGGTFTDLVARSPSGVITTHKLLSENPERYDDAAIQGIRDILGVAADTPIPTEQIAHIKMGTTVATNALLERKGDRTAYVTTYGFGDALRIGYQNRPRLFDLHVVLPELLYEHVVEVNERLDVHGNVLTPLNEAQVREQLSAVFATGIRAVAVALVHAYRWPDHEVRIGEICREIGFTQISLSHQASPLIKLVARGDTTVVDAYLSPILRRYVSQVTDALGASDKHAPELMFMRSNGGLTDARWFQGKDAILSGPAGGVVGMVKTAEMNGITEVIGFDMGGTSTDVAHFSGEYERSFETTIAGVRLRAPMMHIHTVAAGGGSILTFDGARLRVGPESAGANPGPAAYRRGGPLTVTDCNVLLGKIQSEHFPAMFGPEGDQRIDVSTVERQFNALAEEVSSAQGRAIAAETVAEGFLTIAVENMANAIKKISVQRGYDITRYALNCFGGAGGQHACAVADALGMQRILIHPLSGVLSAYGMGLAEVRASREAQLGVALTRATVTEHLAPQVDALARSAHEEVTSQGIDAQSVSISAKVHVRQAGSDTSLLVGFGDADELATRFDIAHKQRYGFSISARDLIAEALSVEAIGQTNTAEEQPRHSSDAHARPEAQVRMFTQGAWHNTPLYQLHALAADQAIQGPAILIDPTGTIVIEPGWQGASNKLGHLILERHTEAARTAAIGTTVDPIMLEVFNNLFMSIAEQMGATLQNTAHSVNIKERLDFSCALFDARGDLVANAPHVPVHLGSMGESVKVIMQANAGSIRLGDAFALNSPYQGGTHLPDVTVVTPVFDAAGSEVLFYVGSRGHHADIGGRTPGSAPPDSRTIQEEGVLLENVRVVDSGEFQEEALRSLLTSGTYPCRNVDQNIADLTAQIAANETGRAALLKLVSTYGAATVRAYMDHVQRNAEESVRRVIDVLEDGSFAYPMDGGQVIRVAVSVERTRREATIDFTGTSTQDAGNYNAPIAVCRAAVLYVFRTLVADDIPLNEGCMAPIKLIVPKGSMLDPVYPAAVMAGNTEVSQAITNALYGALGVLAASQGTMNNFTYGNDAFQNYETICGGTGAGANHDGTSAVQSHMTNTRMTDPEVLELRYPVINERFALRTGSGGIGRYHGGDGAVRALRFLEPAIATVLSSHRTVPPFGLQGGAPGECGRNMVLRSDGRTERLDGNAEVALEPGDVFLIETPGGGGFGPA